MNVPKKGHGRAVLHSAEVSQWLAAKANFNLQPATPSTRRKRQQIRAYPKDKASHAPVPLHPLLAEFMHEWKNTTPYSESGHWVFAWASSHARPAALQGRGTQGT